jgi:hypothetical protein
MIKFIINKTVLHVAMEECKGMFKTSGVFPPVLLILSSISSDDLCSVAHSPWWRGSKKCVSVSCEILKSGYLETGGNISEILKWVVGW